MKRLLVASAVIETGAGAALLIWPSWMVGVLLGPAFPLPSVWPVRMAGLFLFAVGVADAFTSRRDGSRFARGAAWGMTLYNFGAAAGLAAAGIVQPPGGVILWPAVLLHAAMGVWCVLCLRGARRAVSP